MARRQFDRSARPARKILAALALAVTALAASTTAAFAVPSFAEQTGQPCSACHIGSFGPQLTQFGRQFKLEGYTMQAGESFTNPVSAMAIAAFVNTASDQAGPPAPHYGVNNNATIDQISVFVAGGVGSHFGGFTQWTYDGVGRAVGWDNLDLRAITRATVFGSDVLAGLSLNNAPGVQDAWNTLPAWGYPYTGSDLAPAPAAATLFDGGLAQGVLGVSAYAYWDSSLYTEVAAYWTPSHNFLSAMGADEGAGIVSGAAPYFRVAWQKDFGAQNFEVGAFALLANLYPGGDMSAGTTDRYRDLGIDGSYQFIGDGKNIYTVNARYTDEHQNLAASQILLGAANLTNALHDVRLDASYYWHNTIGGSVGVFDTWGSADPLLYADNATFKPNSSGLTFQVDGTLFGRDMEHIAGRLNVRAGLQYTLYTKFDGAAANYDGFGRNASDNNTLRIFTWVAL
ncbi:MAG TPA: hypothetical protein VII56_09585 [Rhizomicrobium sp.]